MKSLIDADTGEVIAQSYSECVLYDLAFTIKRYEPERNLWIL